jgi:hypothetical protein
MKSRIMFTLVLCFGLVPVASAAAKTNAPTQKVALATVPANSAKASARAAGPASSSPSTLPLNNYQLERDSCCVGN